MPRRADPDPPLPAVFSAAEARAAGLTADQIRHRVRSGLWERLGRGYYRLAAQSDDVDGRRREHVDRAIAAALRHRECVVGYRSAAVMHRLPLFHPLPREVELLAPDGHWAGRRAGVVFHRGGPAEGEVGEIRLGTSDAVRVTTPRRTWLDVARTRPLADALTLGDAAARAGLVSIEALRLDVRLHSGLRGCRMATLAAEHVCPLRETPLESGSWAYFVRHRIALPRMQVSFVDAADRFIGRVDFLWEGAGIVGECDGLVKYDTREVLYAEKRREDDLRALGLRVVRWGWRDLAYDRLARVLHGLVS